MPPALEGTNKENITLW